jgi:23S rRNA U2552 (ribose-2'-O)-methylase RlmE/FtsJ
MDLSGSAAAAKPPWEAVLFQQSFFPDDAFFTSLGTISYSQSWNELPHDTLNQLKKHIEPLERNHQWETLKKKSNPYELIYTQESSDCPPSLCIVKPLSRSFFKMIELLQISQFFEKLPKTTQKIRSAHVAEGPGGFIEALLDRSQKTNVSVSKSFAMTLKPTNNHIPGWRRSYNFLQKHPEVKIHYGEDGTGNLYNITNQTSFIQLLETQKVMIFTGDGGFDFSVDYENQEKSVFALLVASAIVGLQVLLPDGTLVLKLFDLYSESTQFLLRLLTVCFREWTLYKPATSRPCNSERYLVCRGFRKAYPAVLQALYKIQTQVSEQNAYPSPSFFSFFSEKEREFLETHIREFSIQQAKILEKTIQLHTSEERFLWKHQYELAQKWCSVFHIPTAHWSAKTMERWG